MNYFGTNTSEAGHYWWAEGMKYLGTASSLDAPKLFRGEEPHPMGEKDWQWSICYGDGHTVLMCWGSVRDKRPNSVTCFVEEGTLTREQMVAQIQVAFPDIWDAIPEKP